VETLAQIAALANAPLDLGKRVSRSRTREFAMNMEWNHWMPSSRRRPRGAVPTAISTTMGRTRAAIQMELVRRWTSLRVRNTTRALVPIANIAIIASGIGPAALLNGHGNRLSIPLPRSRSPLKTNLNSPAQRNRLLARSSSPRGGNAFRETGSSQPTASKRRFDISNQEPSGSRSASQPLFGKAIPKLSATNGRGLSKGRQAPSSDESDGEDQPESNAEQEEEDDVGAFVEESMAMLNADTDVSYPEAEDQPQDAEEDEESEEEVPLRASASSRGGGKPSKQKPMASAAQAAKSSRKRVVEEEVEEEEEEEEEEEVVEGKEEEGEESEVASGKEASDAEPEGEAASSDEEEEVVPKLRKGSGKQKEVTESRPKKRRSQDAEELADEDGISNRQTKRQRTDTTAAPGRRGRPPKTTTARSRSEEKSAAPEKGKRGRKRKSSPAPGDTSHVDIPRGPPLPKARGLLINRRETPGESSSMFRTRSGRNSFKPLAYWRNERVDYDQDEAMNDVFSNKSRPSKIVLPSIKEVVRVDEPEPAPKSRKGASKRNGSKPGRRNRGRSYDDDDEDEIPAEPWEGNPGTVDGQVVCWHPDHEFNPPAQDDYVLVEDKQLAISAAAVATQEVKGATFRYAKTLSEGFFNVGVVDLPPGSEKRPKNSRKMFMTFFVHTGRVLVTVNETSFRISKGGMWFVPRGESETPVIIQYADPNYRQLLQY